MLQGCRHRRALLLHSQPVKRPRRLAWLGSLLLFWCCGRPAGAVCAGCCPAATTAARSAAVKLLQLLSQVDVAGNGTPVHPSQHLILIPLQVLHLTRTCIMIK
jgi:hypothetical protein